MLPFATILAVLLEAGTPLHGVASCPAAKRCGELESARRVCENSGHCDSFFRVLAGLLRPGRCRRDFDSGDVPPVWLCVEIDDPITKSARDGFDLALHTLTKLRTREARRLLASESLRAALDGYLAEEFRGPSLDAERLLLVGDGDVGGPGPQLEGGNWRSVSARASTALAHQGPNRFDAKQVVDGKPFTAWCEGKEGAGLGEWVEVTLDPPEWVGLGPICGFDVIPGYAKTNRSYRANGAPTRVRVSSCARPGSGFEGSLVPDEPADFNRSLVYLPVPPGALDGERRCVRFEILDTRAGVLDDTCISEIVPLYDCADRAQ